MTERKMFSSLADLDSCYNLPIKSNLCRQFENANYEFRNSVHIDSYPTADNSN